MRAGHTGHKAGLPRHPAHEAAQHGEGDTTTFGTPQLGIDEVLYAGERRGLVGEDDPTLGDAVTPPGVRDELAGVDPSRRSIPPVGEGA